MANIFTLEKNEDFSEKINMDELYEHKQKNDFNKLLLFQKILNRVHVRIKTISKQNKFERICWYIVPEVIIGVPKYDQAACIAYIMDKLQDNGFQVRYFHPNTLLISWNHWVPTYIRNEIKKKTGIIVNEYGEKIDEDGARDNDVKEKSVNHNSNINNILISKENNTTNKNTKKFTPIESYKPTGNLIYNESLFQNN
jgi:hypothetical protein